MKMLAFALPIAVVISAPAYAQAMSPTEYVAMAGSSDMYEIQSSQTVLQSTQDPKIRSFAQMMIQHHTKSTADVKAAAAKSRLKPKKPMLMPAHAELVTQLKAENGTARDQAYIAQQKQAHGQALELHKSYAEGGTAPALKMAAGKIVPVVQQHIDMLKTM
jgi:putative membrane protein